MVTAYTCTTPEEGWSLYSHFLGNLLSLICLNQESLGEENDPDKKERIERVTFDAWAQLVGNLYIIMRRMKANGHDDVADKMQQIIDMTATMDVRDPEVQTAIHAKHEELDANVGEFNAVLAQLRAEHGGDA